MSNIKDVAAHAGVSFKTVARVVNNEPSVRESTREKVLRSIEALNYRPNTSAKMMRNQKSGVFGIIMETRSSMAPAVKIIQEAQHYARKHGKLVITSNVTEHDRASAIEQMLNLRVDGIIYATMYHREVEIPPELEGTPMVLVNCYSKNPNIPAIIPNEHQAGLELTQRMLNKGFRKIAFLNLNGRVIAASERLQGYKSALAMSGIAVNPDYLKYAEVESHQEGASSISVTDEVLTELLEMDNPPDAIICGKDEIALEVYLYLAHKGIKPGTELGIGSFDNMEHITRWLKPSLSTMELPHTKMGQVAMQYLLGEPLNRNQHLVDWDFVEGTSF